MVRMKRNKDKDSLPKSTLHDELLSRGFNPHHKLDSRQELSLKEERTKYIMQLVKKLPTISFKIDGHIITEGNKCDFMILIERDNKECIWEQVFVELKGTDVEHAINQLETTLGADILKTSLISNRRARVVALSFPSSKSDPTIEKAKRRFLSKYNCELKTLKSGNPDRI